MNDLNNVILTGRVTRDVELKYTTSGTAVANFSIAVNEGIKQQDGRWEDVANFFEITLWGKQAENMSRFLTKGKQVTVQGRLKQHSWQSEDGSNRSKVTVNAQFLQLLSSPDGGNGRHDGGAGSSGRNYGGAAPQRRPATHREPQSAAARYSSPIESDDDAVPPEFFLDDDIPF